MEVAVCGYLLQDYNPELLEKKYQTKHIVIKCIDEDRAKIKHVVDNYTKTNMLFPILNAPDGGWLVKLSTQKLEKYVSADLRKMPVKAWCGCEYKVRFAIKKYSFKSTYDNNKGDNIEGVRFILKDFAQKN